METVRVRSEVFAFSQKFHPAFAQTLGQLLPHLDPGHLFRLAVPQHFPGRVITGRAHHSAARMRAGPA